MSAFLMPSTCAETSDTSFLSAFGTHDSSPDALGSAAAVVNIRSYRSDIVPAVIAMSGSSGS
eukprot:6002875-Prymnesium_polylepis.1